MTNDYPRIASDTGDEITWERCVLCESDAMMEFEGKGYCGMHYAEKMGWLEFVELKDAVLPENLIPEGTNEAA